MAKMVNPNTINDMTLVNVKAQAKMNQLVQKIGKGKTAVDRGISNLKEKGYIEHIGSNRTGYWKILI